MDRIKSTQKSMFVKKRAEINASEPKDNKTSEVVVRTPQTQRKERRFRPSTRVLSESTGNESTYRKSLSADEREYAKFVSKQLSKPADKGSHKRDNEVVSPILTSTVSKRPRLPQTPQPAIVTQQQIPKVPKPVTMSIYPAPQIRPANNIVTTTTTTTTTTRVIPQTIQQNNFVFQPRATPIPIPTQPVVTTNVAHLTSGPKSQSNKKKPVRWIPRLVENLEDSDSEYDEAEEGEDDEYSEEELGFDIDLGLEEECEEEEDEDEDEDEEDEYDDAWLSEVVDDNDADLGLGDFYIMRTRAPSVGNNATGNKKSDPPKPVEKDIPEVPKEFTYEGIPTEPCILCYDNPKCVAAPCGHMFCCLHCAQGYVRDAMGNSKGKRECPNCKKPFAKLTRIFF